jgi:hypothetical protein
MGKSPEKYLLSWLKEKTNRCQGQLELIDPRTLFFIQVKTLPKVSGQEPHSASRRGTIVENTG